MDIKNSKKKFFRASICKILVSNSKPRAKKVKPSVKPSTLSPSLSPLPFERKKPITTPKSQTINKGLPLLDHLFSHLQPSHSIEIIDQYLLMNQTSLNKFINWCKADQRNLRESLLLLFSNSYLGSKSIRLRYLTLLLVNIVFCKSPIARDFISFRLIELVKFTIAPKPINYRLATSLLPGTTPEAIALQEKSIEIIIDWYQTYSSECFQLESVIDYLQHSLHFDVQLKLKSKLIEAENQVRAIEAQKQEEARFLQEWSTLSPKLKQDIPLFESCLHLILNTNSHFDTNTIFNETLRVKTSSTNLETLPSFYGLGSSTYSLTVSVPTLSSFNISKVDSALLDQANEYYRLFLMRYLPILSPWVSKFKENLELQKMYQDSEKLCALSQSIGLKLYGPSSERESNVDINIVDGVKDEEEDENEEFIEVLPF